MDEKRERSISLLIAAIAASVLAVLLFIFYDNPKGFKKFWKDLRDKIWGKLKKKSEAAA